MGQAAAAASGTVYVPAAKRQKKAEDKAAAAERKRQLQVTWKVFQYGSVSVGVSVQCLCSRGWVACQWCCAVKGHMGSRTAAAATHEGCWHDNAQSQRSIVMPTGFWVAAAAVRVATHLVFAATHNQTADHTWLQHPLL